MLINTPQKCISRLGRCVHAADYRGALAICERGLKRWPKDFQIQSAYAATLGDYAEQLHQPRRLQFKSRCVYLLKRLVHRLRSIDAAEAFRARNEYYYHSGQFKKQYLLGREGVSKGLPRAWYSQGVGASRHAIELAESWRLVQARAWARKAVQAWEVFIQRDPKYYNAYVHYALALGVLGKKADMERALKTAARLSNQPAGYREFKEVRERTERLAAGSIGRARLARRSIAQYREELALDSRVQKSPPTARI